MANIGLFLPMDDKILMGRIESNYDKDTLAVVIYDQQELEIKPLVGTGLYNEIQDQIEANTLSALNTTLLNMLRDALRHYVLADWQFESTAKNTNKGSQIMSGDSSQPASIDMLAQRVQRYKDKAQVYADRVTRYLCENSSDYPLYSNPGNGVDIIHPNKQNYRTGWVMDVDDYDQFYNSGLENPSV